MAAPDRADATISNGRVMSRGDGSQNCWTRYWQSCVAHACYTGAKCPGWGTRVTFGSRESGIVARPAPRRYRLEGAPRGGQSGAKVITSWHLDGARRLLRLTGESMSHSRTALLWNHSWPSDSRIMQPAVAADGELMMSVGDGMGGNGMRRIGGKQGSSGWTTEERWTSEDLISNFNDFVIHKGHAFGFDYGTVACIDLKDGKRKWKGARYGYGQLVLLPDQDVLLVLSEKGELALVKATPDQFTELARFPAIEGKTWNHPVLVGDVLLVRNDQEMAAFRLSLANR